ncbi:MAG: ISL3 family transposase [Blastocatellia bacterium]
MTIPFEQLLNLPDIRILSVEMNQDSIKCEIESTRGYALCHQCGQRATKFFESGETLRLRHLPICEREVTLYLHTKRYLCQFCSGRVTTTERGSWYDTDAQCTKPFANSLLRALVNSTIEDVADTHQVTYGCVRGLLTRAVLPAVDWERFDQLPQLGIDEISLRKGHKDFVTLISTRDQSGQPDILAALEGRKKETVLEFLKTIPQRLQATIEEVCTDLYEGFINAAKEVLPAARVVADRFHVAKLYRAALDELRKVEMKDLKSVLNKEQYAGLKGVLWALRRKQDDLTEEEKNLLELLFECSPALRQAYRLREKLTAIFDTKQTPEAARAAFEQWIKEVKQSGLDCFNKFIGTLSEHLEIITNYFHRRSNSGWIEGLNNKIKVLKRRCYGLTNPINLFRRVWLELNGKLAFAS